MKQLSVLMWLSITLMVVPFLAVPLWLMKSLIITLALIIAVLVYSLLHQSRSAVSDLEVSDPEDQPTPQKHPFAENDEQQTEEYHQDPADITSPDTDRFAGMNSYENRKQQLRKR